jgi:predicted dehydrogenase
MKQAIDKSDLSAADAALERRGTANQARRFSRRAFLSTSSGAAALTILPRSVLAGTAERAAPSDRLTLACIGVGAQGTRVMMDFLKQPDVQIVAVCDVNRESSDYSEWDKNELRDKVRALLGDANWGSAFTGPTAGREPARQIVDAYYAKSKGAGGSKSCAAYNDFRELLEKGKDLDGVVVCTPDHWHAPISITAMRAGKHTYCQKPMTHSVHEARRMAAVARETKVATSVALAISASPDSRHLEEWIAAGVIGPVRRVENWSTRPFWPQGIDRPTEVQPVPDGLDWDLWLGPAPARPFNHAYLPFVWRGWFDFGCGCIGDMANYSFDTIFRCLKLTPPTAVEASSTKPYPETFPAASILRWEFGARGEMPPVDITWYDGGLQPKHPDILEDGRAMGQEDEGLLLIGDKGTIMCGFEGENPQLIPAARMKDFVPPPDSIPPSIGHYREFIEAAKGNAPPPRANFEYESAIVETILLGNVALRAREKLRWDSASLQVTNSAAAQPLIHPPYRGDWGKVIG